MGVANDSAESFLWLDMVPMAMDAAPSAMRLASSFVRRLLPGYNTIQERCKDVPEMAINTSRFHQA